jgi:hypothetical protein
LRDDAREAGPEEQPKRGIAMSAAEAPKSEQIQANVAAALSRLRGELGAASSPVASATPIPMPKLGAETGPAEEVPDPLHLVQLPAGPVRMPETTGAVRPFEPILNAVSAASAPSNDTDPKTEPTKPDLFGRLRADPSLATDRAAAAAIINANEEAKPDSQPDLLSGMEVPPAPPPPLGSFDAEDEDDGRGRRMRNRLLVLVALVVIGGGAAWAWISSHRAPDGPVPVIAADTTPEKVKPEDEGGMQVPNQNVQILDNMNGGQSTAEQQQTVMPPPEQPVSPPTTETTDQATAEAQPPAVSDTKPAETAPTPPAITDQAPPPVVDAPAIPSVSAPEPGQTAATATPAPVVPEPQPQTATPAPAESTPAPATTAEKPAEPAPAPAPVAETPKAAEPTQTAATPTAPAQPSVAPTAGGNARIQLAAVKSEALANDQWAKFQKAHPDLLGALTLNVQKVTVNGGTLYRIQAGPLSKAQAKDLCVKLKAQKQDCIVAK